MNTPPRFLSTAPDDLVGWVVQFDVEKLPILSGTAVDLQVMRENEDAVDAHLLAEVVASDPLLTLKLFAHVGQLRCGREGSDPETVTAALVMLGIPPFFRAFSEPQTVDSFLAHVPGAMAGFNRVLERSRRAARFAIGFAVHRMDYDASVIYEAALLHDFAELLLWLKAPSFAMEIARRQRIEPGLRSACIQRELLRIELDELEHALMLKWRLPGLLVQMTDEHACSPDPQLRNVQLAIRLARHSADGWENAALPDDMAAIAQLLSLSLDATERLVREIDSEVSS